MGSAASAPNHAGIPVAPWLGLEGQDHFRAWRANVGAPVALDIARPAAGPISRLAILSWNLWIGRGRLPEVVARVRAATASPLIVLTQEAFRADASLPVHPTGRGARRAVRRVAGAFPPRPFRRADIVETARELGLNLRYVPSMRNGSDPSDRGNAILSDLPLADARAFELPFLLQRRVPVVATVDLPFGALLLVSAHLDPRGPPGAEWLGGAGRARQTSYLLDRVDGDLVALGADLNLGRGTRETSWRLLLDAGFANGAPAARRPWRHTFHGVPRLVLDHVLLRDRAGRVTSATVERLDEHPRDRGPTVFGSDHHPLLAQLELTPGGAAS